MPLIDIAELMDKMNRLLAAAPPAANTDTGAAPESLLGKPSPALNAPLRSYSQVYGSEHRMLKQLARDATAEGAPELATLLNALDQGLLEGAFDLSSAPLPAPRLGRYVYPVV